MKERGWLMKRCLVGTFFRFDQIDEDTARAALDRKLIVDVLGLDPSLCDHNGPSRKTSKKTGGRTADTCQQAHSLSLYANWRNQ